VLASLGAGEKPTVTVYNKVDQLAEDQLPAPEFGDDPVSVSALSGYGIDRLLARLARVAARRRLRKQFFLPYEKSGLIPLLHERGRVISQEHRSEGIWLEVELEEVWASRVEARLKGQEISDQCRSHSSE